MADAGPKIGLYGDKFAFGVGDKACYWAFGRHCKNFSFQDLFHWRDSPHFDGGDRATVTTGDRITPETSEGDVLPPAS